VVDRSDEMNDMQCHGCSRRDEVEHSKFQAPAASGC
jgi:hypothetical protein